MIDAIEHVMRVVYWVAPILLGLAFSVWLMLTVVLVAGRLRHDRCQRILRAAQAAGEGTDVGKILSRLPVAVVTRAALDTATRPGTAAMFARHVLARSDVERLVRTASKHADPRHDRRRIRALRLLALGGYPSLIALLNATLHSGREDVVDAAVSLLGTLKDEQAAVLLVGALRERLFQTSRVATELDHFDVPIAHLIRPLLDETDSKLRFWGVALAARYLDAEGFRDAVLRLTRDDDPQVRKTAIQALRHRPDAVVAAQAARLTRDPVFYVRAHAARTLAACRDASAAPDIVRLLSDPDWWVRLAARESLVSLGPAVVPAVLPLLESSDPVLAAGAAEIVHNVGYVNEMLPKLATCRQEEAARCFAPLVAAGGELLIATVLARYSSADMPAHAWLEPALRRAARA